VQLWLTAEYFVPHRVLRRGAVAAGLTDVGWDLGEREDCAILSVSDPELRPGRAAPDDAGNWILRQLEMLNEKGLLLDLDGNGNVATIAADDTEPQGRG
jgi:hypothetical protein